MVDNQQEPSAQREAFEEWADNEGIDLEAKGGFHELAAINMWTAWQAAQQSDRELIRELVFNHQFPALNLG